MNPVQKGFRQYNFHSLACNARNESPVQTAVPFKKELICVRLRLAVVGRGGEEKNGARKTFLLTDRPRVCVCVTRHEV